ncbi:MAG: glycoside hydrolase family 2 TIM barrel-domain containing protein [Terriglobia bacterium]
MRPMRSVVILCSFLSLSTVLFGADVGSFDISPRQELNFSTGWVFIPKDLPGAEQPGFDDYSFERVSVPHANILTPHETFDPDMFRFVSWYRKHFRPQDGFRGKDVLVEFQGVMTVADVYLNGRLLGHHEGGYTPFTVDLTPALKFDAENLLAVRVDSREQKQVPPEGADKMYGYYLFGGIQRDVWLRVVDPCHIERVYYTTAAIQPEVRQDVQITITNGRPQSVDGELVVHLLDADGKEVALTKTPATLAAGATRDLKLAFDRLRGIDLWDVDHPHRYVMMAELRDGSTVLDRERTWIGIRAIHWDETTGQFSLNDRPLKLRGMNRHQTFAYVGGAAPNRLERRDARILKYEMGLNMMRCSHYPPDPEFLDECDRIGLLVMDEFPAWQFIGKSERWQDNAVQAVRDMILRDRNHPCVILWGVRGNEASPREEDDRELYTRTYALARQLDPTRPPGGARLSDAWHGKFVPEEVMTVNDYSDWEGPAHWPQLVTGKPWLITEYGNPKQYPVWAGERELLEFTFHWMNYLDRLYSHPEIAGGVGWAALDYNSPEFDTPVAVTAHHCVDDIFRLPKGFDSYALASQANPSIYGPMLKILSTWRNNGGGKIYVASNAPEVELSVNGKPLGRAKPTEFPHAPHPLFLFKVGAFEPGELQARAWMGGKVVATDIVRTPGRPRRLVLRADDTELIDDGADMTRVVATAVDEQGTPAPTEDRRIFIEVSNGNFIGESPIHLEAGRIAFYVQTRKGWTLPITIRVTADGLEPSQTLEVKVQSRRNSLVPLSDFDAGGLATLH